MLKQQYHLTSQSSGHDSLFNRNDGLKVEARHFVLVVPSEQSGENPRFACARARGYPMKQTRRRKSQQCTVKNSDRNLRLKYICSWYHLI